MTHTITILGALLLLWGFIYAYNPWNIGTMMWALAGNSRTMAVAYSAQVVAVLEAVSTIDLTPLIGASNAGRVISVMSVVMIVMRVITGNLDFKAKDE